MFAYLHTWHFDTVQQGATWHSRQRTTGPWCHHLTVVQMSVAVCGLHTLGVFWLLPNNTAVVQGHSGAAAQQGHGTHRLKMAHFYLTAQTTDPFKRHSPTTSTWATAIMCVKRGRLTTQYWCFTQLSLCVSIKVRLPYLQICWWLQYWAKCLHIHIIRLIGLAPNVVVSWWKWEQAAAVLHL